MRHQTAYLLFSSNKLCQEQCKTGGPLVCRGLVPNRSERVQKPKQEEPSSIFVVFISWISGMSMKGVSCASPLEGSCC